MIGDKTVQDHIIDYYYSAISPWSYFGHARLGELAARHTLTIAYHPMPLGKVFAGSGGLALKERHPSRQAMRLLELQRWREKLKMPLTLWPKFWPFDASMADRVTLSLLANGHNPHAFIAQAFEGCFAREENAADVATLASYLTACGFDADKILAHAQTDEIAITYQHNAEEALNIGVFGSPSFVYHGEIFFGQDRLDLLEDAIASGRAPFVPVSVAP